MIIDAHAHLGRHFVDSLGGDYLDQYAASAELWGVDRVLVSSIGLVGYEEHPDADTVRLSNDDMREALESHPVFAGMVYTSGSHVEVSLEQMREHIENGPCVGVKLWIDRKADDPACDPIFEYAADLDVPVLQHAALKRSGQRPGESTPADVAAAARRHPRTTIQMAHTCLCTPRGLREVADCPNVVVDVCGSDPLSGTSDTAIRILGADRVLFGSDAPGRDIGVQLTKVLGDDLSDAERDAVLAGNALRIYRRLEGRR